VGAATVHRICGSSSHDPLHPRSATTIILAMASYRIGQAAELLGVSVDTVRRWADSGRLATRRTGGGQRVIDGADLARFVTGLAPAHEPEGVSAQSARNRFTGIVTRVVKGTVAAQVEVQAGRYRVVSLMTREAADELGLAPGVLAVAAVKATNVVIELPAPS
jgi:molybdopterin-binding protein